MGRAIFYCNQCSKRLSDAELDSGKAFRIGDRIVCSACATPEERAAVDRRSTRINPVSRAASSSAAHRSLKHVPAPAEAPGPARGGRSGLRIGIAAAALGVIVVLGIVGISSGKSPASPVRPPAPGKEPAPTAAAPAPKEELLGRRELELARESERKHPKDLVRAATAYNDIVWNFAKTPAAKDAEGHLDRIKGLIRDEVAFTLAALEAELRPLRERQDFRSVDRLLAKAQDRLPYPEWALELGRRREEIKAQVNQQGEDLARKDPEESPPRPPSATPAPDPDPSPELKAWRARWPDLSAKASARDYAGAASDLKRAAEALTDELAKREAMRDLEDLGKVETLHRAALKAASARKRGSGLGLRTLAPARRLSGSILQIDDERVELKQPDGSVFVEWADVAPSSLVRLLRDGAPDPRTLALYCLLEGDLAGAEGLPAEGKWTLAAAGSAHRVPAPEASEGAARELFYAAEREYRSLETRIQAAEKYRQLKTDFAASRLAGKYLPRILRRSAAGQEYWFSPADVEIGGTMIPTQDGPVVSKEDSEANRADENFVSFSFAALPAVPYRLWIHVGACCAETFMFMVQATEMTAVHPKTRKPAPCEPGSGLAPEVKHGIRNLKRTHASHSPKGEPKGAQRWEWVEVKLPVYSGAGRKEVRFLTDQAGFSFRGAFVSTSARKPPSDEEIRALVQARLEDEPPLPVDPDLVAWWTFDEGSGDKAADATGHGHVCLLGGAGWTEGRSGTALRFSGRDVRTGVAHAPELDLKGDFTVAFWARQDADHDDWRRMVGKGEGNARTFGFWEWPKDDKRIKFQSSSGERWYDIDGSRPMELGRWTHLAATMKGNLGTLYFNGVKDGEKTRTFDPAVGNWPLTVGHAPIHAPFDGAIDDLRIYRRALAAEEILELAEFGP